MPTIIENLTQERDSLRDMTTRADQKASLLLIGPGSALATIGTVAGLDGVPAAFGTLALAVAVAIVPAIVGILWPRLPKRAVQTVADIWTEAEGVDAVEAADRLAVEVQALQRIMAVKWWWTRIALRLTLAAVALAGVTAAVATVVN